jgi:gluconolactonase
MTRFAATAALLLATATVAAAAGVPAGPPIATIDLRTTGGVASLGADWKFHDVTIDAVDFRAAGADRKPTGRPNRTYDIAPHAGAAAFDETGWETLDPTTLEERRSTGKVCFAWYRIRLTLPERVADLPVAGTTVVFETTVDDYAEVWVDGQLPRELGQSGGSLVAGFNVPNRLVLAENARPGQVIQVAIFAMNGPISDPPSNYIWMRRAVVEFHRPAPAMLAIGSTGGTVHADGPGLESVFPAGTTVEKLADGFGFAEGPAWSPDGRLYFSDPNTNVIYRWSEGEGAVAWRAMSGYAGPDVGRYRQPGSNGLAFDREGRLTICQHGNRRVVRLETDGTETVLADRYEGKRLNSPNDLVYKSDGALYFTDPWFGLPGFDKDPDRETPWAGIYRWKDGRLTLLDTSLAGPNGLAFSPDEKYLYVGNWDPAKKWLVRYEVRKDGTLGPPRRFADLASGAGEEALDGVKVDARGHVFASGPGGVWVFGKDGRHLGTLEAPELPANFAWGDADGRTLYLTARTGLYRVRVGIPGHGLHEDRAGLTR